MHVTVMLIAAVPVLGWPVQVEPVAKRQVQTVQTHLDLSLTVDYEARTLAGTATIKLENRGAEPVEIVPLQLGRLMSVAEIRSPDGTAIPFQQSVVTYEDWPEFQVNQIYAQLSTSLAPNDTTSLALDYGGYLVGYTETGMQYVRDQVDSSFTIIRSDARAFPIIATPSLRERRAAPRADFHFSASITVPFGQVVAAAVPPTRRDDRDGRTTWTFRSIEPVPFLNIAIAPYRTLTSGGMRIFHFAEDSSGAEAVRAGIGNATARLENWFGPRRRQLEITVIEIPEGFGSQASLSGGIIQTADAFRSRRSLAQIYHEMAHLWHPRDTEASSPRWNEGLAMFLQYRLAERLDQTFTMDSVAARTARSLISRNNDSSPVASIPMSRYGIEGMTGFSYRTGHLMFYVLYRVLGETTFDRLMSGYFDQYRERGSDTQQFADYFIDNSPIDIAAVFEDWLFTPRWFQRLGATETMRDLVVSYR